MTRPPIGEEDFEFEIERTRGEKLVHVKDKLRDYKPLSSIEQAWLLENTNVLSIKLQRPANRPKTSYVGLAKVVDGFIGKKETAYKAIGEAIGRPWRTVEKAYLAEKRRSRQKSE